MFECPDVPNHVLRKPTSIWSTYMFSAIWTFNIDKKWKFSEWACLVPKVLVNSMASFLCYLEPPNCHIMQNPKKYRKLLILLIFLYFPICPFKGTIGHLRKPPSFAGTSFLQPCLRWGKSFFIAFVNQRPNQDTHERS